MQEYILRCADGDGSLPELYRKIGYSRRHADRLFRELLGCTPQEYLRSLRLSRSAGRLLEEGRTVLDVALDSDYGSHEGYTRAFLAAFGIPPARYRQGRNAIPLFTYYPIRDYYRHMMAGEENGMDEKNAMCMITPVERPKRKLLLMRSERAVDYWSFCEERGCGWHGLFGSVPQKLDTPAILTLPPFLMKPGFGSIAAGIELPEDCVMEVPEDCEMADLPACTMLYFQTPSFEREEDYTEMIGLAFRALSNYDAAFYGYGFADELAPRFNFGADCAHGARLAVPVRRLAGR